MKKSLQIFYIFISFSFFFVACESNKNKEPEKLGSQIIELHTIDTTKLKDAKELTGQFPFKITSNFSIAYFSSSKKEIYLKLDTHKNIYFYTKCEIDTAFEADLLNLYKKQIIYRGSFSLPGDPVVKLTFIAINVYYPKDGTYRNLFNDYVLAEKSQDLHFEVADDFIEDEYGALICSYKEGSGDYLDFKIYGLNKNKFSEIYEPYSPLENGYIRADSGKIFSISNLTANKLSWVDDSVRVEQLKETPLIDFNEGDKILKIEFQNDKIITPKLIIISQDAVLHLLQKGENSEYQINYDDDFWDRNFNQLIPKKKGITSITIENTFHGIEKRIKILIV